MRTLMPLTEQRASDRRSGASIRTLAGSTSASEVDGWRRPSPGFGSSDLDPSCDYGHQDEESTDLHGTDGEEGESWLSISLQVSPTPTAVASLSERDADPSADVGPRLLLAVIVGLIWWRRIGSYGRRGLRRWR
jgi:hypothetical protein